MLALERFISRRVEINYHARLVLYLREKGIISQEEADAQLHPAIAGGYRQPASGYGLGGTLLSPNLQRLAVTQIGILAAMTLGVAFVHASQLGTPPQVAAPAPPAPPPGYLRVLADPWAEVWVDDQLVETTPFARSLPVPEGTHRVTLKNPYYKSVDKDVEVHRGETSLLRATLVRK